MQWNVYYYNMNVRKIEVFNIFNHGSFRNDIIKYAKKCKDKDGFAEELKRSLFYYFGHKSEWEVQVVPWVGHESDSLLIDIRDQVCANWDIFLDYVWEHRKELKIGYGK